MHDVYYVNDANNVFFMVSSGICHGNKETNKTYERLESLFPMLSSAYLSISKDQKRQFFGLRDFYRYMPTHH